MLNSDASYYWNSNWSPMAGGGNYAITYNDNFSTKELRIFKRNETGFYPRIATKTLTSEAKDVSTDGRFFTYEDKAAKSVEIFEVDDEGNIFNSQNVSSPFRYGKLLEDGTYIAITETSLVTYTYDDVEGWIQKDESSYGNGRSLIYYGQLWPYHLTTTTFAGVRMEVGGVSYVFLMRRNSDFSWTFEDQIDFNLTAWTSPYSTVWDGDDTIIMGHPAAGEFGDGASKGRITIRIKDGDEWIVQKNITLDDLGYLPTGYLGFNLHMIGKDSVLATVPEENTNATKSYGGAVVLLTCDTSRQWNAVAQFRGEADRGRMGIQVGQSASDLLMLNCGALGGLNCYIFTYSPGCLADNELPVCDNTAVEITAEQCAGDTPTGINPEDFYQLPADDCGSSLVVDQGFVKRSDGFILTVTFTRTDHIVHACRVKIGCQGSKSPQGKFNSASTINATGAAFVASLFLLF
jgi:hypothetical protein